MLRRLIDISLAHRGIVLALAVAFSICALWIAREIPIDAFPDLTNNQVTILTECPGMSPGEVEQLVTYPIESTVMGLPRTEQVRSISKLGLSIVTIVFEDSVNKYFARQVVNERLLEVRSRIPRGIEPVLGPLATAFGEIYQYTIEGRNVPLMDRKTLQDWQIRNQLRTVRGINEVNSWGGETQQFAVEIDPTALQRYGLTLGEIAERVRENNANFGGGYIENRGEQFTVRGLGRAANAAQLKEIVVQAREGTPVLLGDVARIEPRAKQRYGAVLKDGKGETVSGMPLMLAGENGREVARRVKATISQLRLPAGVRLTPFYDQTEIIEGTLRTVRRNLLEAGLLVIAVLLLFLRNYRAALIVAAVIPFSMLFGFVGMAMCGISANLMSLGAIDFGMIVDGAVVMVEHSVRRLSESPGQDRREVIRHAAREVARPIVFAVLIIIAVYIPIFALEGLEGRMFRPMAITVCSALAGSLLLSFTVVPAASSLLLPVGQVESEGRWFHRLRERYDRSLEFVLRRPKTALAAGLLPVAGALWSLTFIGTEFMPALDEGSILIQTRKLPGISLTDSVRLSNELEKVIMEMPEVQSVVTKLGRPDVATEAMGVYEGDVYVLLKPANAWRSGMNKAALVADLAGRIEDVPGMVYNFTQPMAMRVDEVVSGIKADVAVKIFGEDPATLTRLAERALRIISVLPGAADAQAEITSGVGELRVAVRRDALARYGLNVSDVQELVEASSGGLPVSEVIDGQRRFGVSLLLPFEYRTDAASLGSLHLQAPGGERVALSQIADIGTYRGPEVISRENGQRRIVVQSNVRGRDLGSFVKAAQDAVARDLRLPPGYSIDWGGQFENQERANRRLSYVLPISIAVIFSLLFATFHSLRQAFLILLNVPFALVGGIAALWMRHMNLNLSASVGFIALFGVAVLNGIVMVSYINSLRAGGMPEGEAVRTGASLRLRPVLMTALVASLGFLPMALSTSVGAEVQRPLATVVIGGLVTSTLLTLYLLPTFYRWFSPADKA